MKVHVLDIPILRQEIVQYLLSHQLASCALVSKQWNYWFTPALWHTVDLKKSDFFRDGPSELHLRHAELIRSMILNNIQLPNNSLPNLPSLRSLNILGCANQEEKIYNLISKSPSLTKIVIFGINSAAEESTDKLSEALLSVPMLSHLELTINCSIAPEIILDIITSHPRLDTLHINCDYPICVPPSITQIQSINDALYQMEDIQFKTLCLGFCNSLLEAAFTIPLIKRCHRLETLNIVSMQYQSNLKLIAETLKEKKNSRVRSFQFIGNGKNGQCIDEFLTELRDISDRYFFQNEAKNNNHCIESTSSCGIEELALYNIRSLHILHSIPFSLLSNTLTSLKVDSSFTMGVFMELLNNLPMLRIFQGVSCHIDNTEKLERMYNIPWTCLNMENFCISLSVFHRKQGNRRVGSSQVEKATEFLLSQIGRLTKLKELKIGSTSHILRRRNGNLDQLSNLKELRVLDLRKYGIVLPSPKDFIWMIDNWPKLDTVIFGERFQREPSSQVPVIRTIHQKNPYIDVRV